jgi:hypothetical protein
MRPHETFHTYRVQQELLAARRTGSQIKEANVRRAKVQQTLAERKVGLSEGAFIGRIRI